MQELLNVLDSFERAETAITTETFFFITLAPRVE